MSKSRVELTDEFLHLEFLSPHSVLSSAVMNGGLKEARHILNLRVPKHSDTEELPATTLARVCAREHWTGPAVGMMTAAWMDSFRIVRESLDGVEIAAMVTTGLANARCVGDRAEYRSMRSAPQEVGTINIIVVSSASMSPAAMVEAVQMVTEAKTAVLRDAGITSPVSGELATGTGTDSVAIAAPAGECPEVSFCGKHVLFGEVLGRLVTQAVTESIRWDTKPTSN